MIIGINLLFLIPNKVGGTETYIRLLIKYLEKIDNQNNYIVFCNEENFSSISLMNKNWKKEKCKLRASQKVLRIIYEQIVLPILVIKNKVNILFSPGYISPLMPGFKSVVTIHDLNWYFHPEEFSKLALIMTKLLVKQSARRADHIVTDSENSRKDIIRILKILPSRISSIYPGVEVPQEDFDPKETKECLDKYNVQKGFLLCASASYKFKNIPRLVIAFREISKQFPEIKLVITGLTGSGKQDIVDEIKRLSLGDKVIIAGWIPQNDLSILFSEALIYIHPSLYEGFGFPVLEAMSRGCPVISSSSASLPELVGDAGLLVDATKANAITDAVKELLENSFLKTSLIENGFRQIQKFDWTNCAQKYLNMLTKVDNN